MATKLEISEKATLRKKIVDLLKSSEQPCNGELAMQLCDGMPDLVTVEIRKLLTSFKFRHHKFSVDECWFGSMAGKKLSDLDTNQLCEVFSIADRFVKATDARGVKNSEILANHNKSISDRLGVFLELNNADRIAVMSSVSAGSKRYPIHYYLGVVYDVVKCPVIENYEGFGSDALVKALNFSQGSCYEFNGAFYKDFHNQHYNILDENNRTVYCGLPLGSMMFLLETCKVVEEVNKREEIVKAKKSGYLYNKNRK